MDVFYGSELAFGSTYFVPGQSRIMKISADVPVKSLTTAEVPPSAGSFSTSEGGLQNRFILWHAEGPNLYLHEYSLDRDLVDSSLCINFSQSLIVPGTQMFVVRRKTFLLIVPTQSGIHRFYVHWTRHNDDSLGNFALVSRLHEEGELYASHDFYAWKLNTIASMSAIGTNKEGMTVAAVRTMDKQLMRIVFPNLSPLSETVAGESILQGIGVLDRLFMKQSVDTWDVAVVSDVSGQQVIYSVSRDGKIRSFGCESTSVLHTVDLNDLLPREHSQVVDVHLKGAPMLEGANLLLVYIQLVDMSFFVALELQHAGKLEILFSNTLDSIYVVDFACTSVVHSEKFSLWVVVNESPDCWSTAADDGQPYTLKKCEFGGSDIANLRWENVRPATSSSAVDALLFKYPESEAVRNRIFDGNNYSFDVVYRAVQIICKQPKKQHIGQGNWIALSRHLDEFLASGQFKQLYRDTNEDGDDVLLNYGSMNENAKLRGVYEKFWANLQKTCNQLQEEYLRPLAIWSAPIPGLVGVIQMCRFTTYSPPDIQLRAVCDPHDSIMRDLFNIVRPGLKKESIRDPSMAMQAIIDNAHALSRVVKAFVRCCSPPIRAKSIPSKFSKLSSSFASSLCATALRDRIIIRLRCAGILRSLIGIVPQITKAKVRPELDLIGAENNHRISQMITYYTTMWIALSVRLVSQDPNPKQIHVAQAFLKYGGPEMVQRYCDDTKADDFEDGQFKDEEEEPFRDSDEEEELEAMEQDGQQTRIPTSKWDNTVLLEEMHNGGMKGKRTKESPRFCTLVEELISGAICSLWPESPSLTLPRFLAESKFFDALKSYCTLNEPFPPELAYAFRFFQAIALSGQNHPEQAWKIFEELIPAVAVADTALSDVLSCLYPSPSSELATDRTKPEGYSIIEYWNKVMLVFKEHKHSLFVVKAGEQAIHFSEGITPHAENEALALLLSEIYTTLFTQHLVAGSYAEAVRAILVSPNEKRQSVCLRQLVTHLLDTRQVRTLIALPYDSLAGAVVDILEARCKGELVGAGRAHMYDIAYAFHVSRCEYGRAAKLMYELAMRLRQEIQSRALLQRRCNALATVYQTMQIAEQFEEIITFEAEYEIMESVNEDFAIVDLDGQNQSDTNTSIRREHFQLTKEDVAREMLKAEARLALIDADPMAVPPLADEDILRESLSHKRYDMAWLLVKEFGMKPYDLLEKVTDEAIRRDYESDSGVDGSQVVEEEEPDWVIFNKQYVGDAGAGGYQPAHWRIVISYLDLAMEIFPHDTTILRTVANTFLQYSLKLPTWLVNRYMRVHFGDLLRLLIDYDDLEDAFKLLLPQIDVAKRQLQELVARRIRVNPMAQIYSEDLATLLPYTHIEELLQLAEKSTDRNLPISETSDKLRGFAKFHREMSQHPDFVVNA